jgi:hypothetical protein
MDSKSIGMCVATILIKVWADIALSEVGVVVVLEMGEGLGHQKFLGFSGHVHDRPPDIS